MPCPYKHGHFVQCPATNRRTDNFFRSARLLEVQRKNLCMALNPKQWKCARVSSVCENLDCSSGEKFSMYLSHIAIYSVFLNALQIYCSRLQDLYSKLELHPNGNSSVAMLRLAQLRHINSAEESKAESGPWSHLQWTRTNGLLTIRFRSTLSRDPYESKVGKSEDHSLATVICCWMSNQ